MRGGRAWTICRSRSLAALISTGGQAGSIASVSRTPVWFDTDNPVPYSVVVLRDPDNIQLELIYMAG